MDTSITAGQAAHSFGAYDRWAADSNRNRGTRKQEMQNAALGLCGEMAELVTDCLTFVAQDPSLADVERIADEAGDAAYYAIWLVRCGWPGPMAAAFGTDDPGEFARAALGGDEAAAAGPTARCMAALLGASRAAEAVKKVVYHAKDRDVAGPAVAALGAVAILVDGFGLSLPGILGRNVRKLDARYPRGFAPEHN